MEDVGLARETAKSNAGGQDVAPAQPGGKLGAMPGLTPFLLRADQAAALCGTSTRTWRGWDAAGKIPRPVRIGRKTFWRPEELRAWAAAGCPDREIWESLQ